MIRQYLETKAAYPDAVLFFRLGDFYEMFFEDAVCAAGAAALGDELVRIGCIRELLVRQKDSADLAVESLRARFARRPAIATIDDAAFEPARAAAFLRGHFKVASLDGFGLTGSS